MFFHIIITCEEYIHSYDSIFDFIFSHNILTLEIDFIRLLGLLKTTKNMHMCFCKEILGGATTNNQCWSSFGKGRIPITTYGMKNCMKNYSRIHILEKASKLVLSAHLLSLNCALKSTEEVKTHLNRSGIGSENRNLFLFFSLHILFK